MEVLNQNQRKSAIWRIVALATLIIALLCTVVFSMHQAYASLGKDELEAQLEKAKRDRNVWDGNRQKLQNNIEKLKRELRECKDNLKKDDRLQLCEDRIKAKDDRIDELNDELTRCETKLQAATSY